MTLLGAGGIGKTRLAQRIGWETLPHWPGGVWLCDLSEARSIHGIVHTVAVTLGVPLDNDEPIVQLGHAIAGRGECLLILDNFEQVAEFAGTTLGHWIRRAPGSTFLVTSQTRLCLPGETVYEVPPLDQTTHAVDLFEVRAQEHRRDFAVNDSNRDQVLDIVQKLDGLPLAIETGRCSYADAEPEATRSTPSGSFRDPKRRQGGAPRNTPEGTGLVMGFACAVGAVRNGTSLRL